MEARRLAQDENTPSELLARLANIGDRLIRLYVARNPNTPIRALKKLAREFPAEVMANPVLDLLILSNPEEIVELKRSVAQSLNASEEILDRLKDDSDYQIRQYIASNPKTYRKILDYLKNDEDDLVRVGVARNHNTPETTLDYLMKNEDIRVRAGVARNPKTYRKILDYLKNDQDDLVRVGVAQNPNACETTLDYLKNDKDDRVRSSIANNPKTFKDRRNAFAVVTMLLKFVGYLIQY